MPVDKLSINDPRVEHKNVTVRGRNYHYLLAKPKDEPHRATILLIHGFPDLAMGWRYQVPFLVSLGLQVIVPDQLGYGRTDAPDEVELYSMKSLSDDLAALIDKDFPSERQVLVGGHDWGGWLAWRFTEWHSDRVSAVFSICTPYSPPLPQFIDLPDLVEKILPNFRYQLQFASDELPRRAKEGGRTTIRQILNAMYGGSNSESGFAMSTESGIDFDAIPTLEDTKLITTEELDFYADEFARHGFRGPTNWYRTRPVNFKEERELYDKGPRKIPQPALFILATKDAALPPAMSENMGDYFENLTKKTVEGAGHWAQVQRAEEVNRHIEEFLTPLLPKKLKASI